MTGTSFWFKRWRMPKTKPSPTDTKKEKEPLHERLNIYQWSVVAILLWLVFGLVPIALMQLVRLEDLAATRVSQYGAMFGAASAFFSGFALIGIMLTNSAQKKALELQKLELEEVDDLEIAQRRLRLWPVREENRIVHGAARNRATGCLSRADFFNGRFDCIGAAE